MSEVSTKDAPLWPGQVIDRARFAARAYIVEVTHEAAEAGVIFEPNLETTSLAYECGYLRGSNDAHEDLLKSLSDLRAIARETGRLEGEADRIKGESGLLRREAALLEQSNALLEQSNAAEERLLDVHRRLEESLAGELRAVNEIKALEVRIAALEALVPR